MSEVEKIEQTESQPQPEPQAPVKQKQYLLMADEVMRIILSRISPGLQFLEIEGWNMEGNDKHLVIVSPVNKPAPEMPEQ